MGMAQDDKFLRTVKLFNVVAGILLVLGTLVLVGALIYRASGDDESQTPVSTVADIAPGKILLNAGAKSRITGASSSDGHALITTEDADGKQRVFAVELSTGIIREIAISGAAN